MPRYEEQCRGEARHLMNRRIHTRTAVLVPGELVLVLLLLPATAMLRCCDGLKSSKQLPYCIVSRTHHHQQQQEGFRCPTVLYPSSSVYYEYLY